MAIEIDLWYRTSDSEVETHLSLAPESYFDPLRSGATYASDGIPRYDDTWQYLDVPRERLVWSVERRTGTGEDCTFSTQYFDGGKTWINHRSDPSGYEELIHVVDFGDRYLTLRTFKQPGGRWVGHMVSMRESETHAELYSEPDGTFRLAQKLSLELSEIVERQ